MWSFEGERWLDIPGYEGLYQASNYGRIRSIDRSFTKTNKYGTDVTYHLKGRTLVQRLDGKGMYLLVVLRKDGKSHNELVHRLVASTFLRNPDNLPEVNHKDEIKTNNKVENLEYCNRIYNVNYGTGSKRAGTNHCKSVEQFTVDGVWRGTYPSITNAAITLHMSKSGISNCCSNRRKTYGGYVWRFAE